MMLHELVNKESMKITMEINQNYQDMRKTALAAVGVKL